MKHYLQIIKYFLFILIVIFFFGCKMDGKIKHDTITLGKTEKTLSFDIDKEIIIQSFDSIFKKEKLIKLETNPNSLITDVSRIDYYNNSIYVFDIFSDYSVICFDSNGGFKFKLKNIGKGPHEYIRINYGAVNDYTGDIEIIANMGRDFLVYDSIGNFKEKLKLPFTAKSFCSLQNKRYFHKGYINQSENDLINFRIYSMNYSGDDIKKYLPYKVSKNFKEGSYYFGFTKKKKGEYLFSEKYNDTVYKLNSDTFTPLYKINFVGYENNKPDDFLYNGEKYKNRKKSAIELKIPSITGFQEYENYITGMYTNISDDEYIYSFIYDKISEKIIQNRFIMPFSKKINMDIHNLLPNIVINDSPSCYIDPIEIDNYINNPELNTYEYGQKIKEELISYFDFDGNIDANPYIIIYK